MGFSLNQAQERRYIFFDRFMRQAVTTDHEPRAEDSS